MGEITEKFRKKIFSDQNIENITDTLKHIEKVTAVIDKLFSDLINSSITSLNTLLNNSATASKKSILMN